MRSKHLIELDVVRLVSTLLILIYHFGVESATAALPGPAAFGTPGFSYLAEVGIALFFMLSGAALYWQWKTRWSLRRYITGRLLAIYPLFWTAFLALFLYGDVLHGNNPGVPRWKLIYSFLGLDGYLLAYTQTLYKIGEWFLGCLILLYALFPLFFKLQKTKAGRLALGVGMAALWVLWPLVCPPAVEYAHTVLCRAPLFVLGMGLTAAFRKPGALAKLLAGSTALLALSLLLRVPRYYSLCLFAVLLFLAFCLAGPPLEKVPAAVAGALARLSGKCYGVFLVHHITLILVLIPLMRRLPLPWPVWLAAFIVVSFLLSPLLQFCATPLRSLLSRALRPKM